MFVSGNIAGTMGFSLLDGLEPPDLNTTVPSNDTADLTDTDEEADGMGMGMDIGMDMGMDIGMDMDQQQAPPQGGGQAGGFQPQQSAFTPQPMMGGQPGPGVQQVQFPNLAPSTGGQDSGNISLLMDVFMEMTVELGRTKKPIREILGMGEGTIIELDKLAGEPVDVLVNNKAVAKGEVVVVDENFGVRITQLMTPEERLHRIANEQ